MPIEEKMKLAKTFHDARRFVGVSREEAAQMLGIPTGEIDYLETFANIEMTGRPPALPVSSSGEPFDCSPSFGAVVGVIVILVTTICMGSCEIMSQKRDKNPAKHLQYLEPTTTGSAVNGVRG